MREREGAFWLRCFRPRARRLRAKPPWWPRSSARPGAFPPPTRESRPGRCALLARAPNPNPNQPNLCRKCAYEAAETAKATVVQVGSQLTWASVSCLCSYGRQRQQVRLQGALRDAKTRSDES